MRRRKRVRNWRAGKSFAQGSEEKNGPGNGLQAAPSRKNSSAASGERCERRCRNRQAPRQPQGSQKKGREVNREERRQAGGDKLGRRQTRAG